MDNTGYLQTLESVYNEYKTESEKPECIFDAFEKQINGYHDFIPRFFSKDCECRGISDVYGKLKSNTDLQDLSVDCIDNNLSHHIYKEYLDGMHKFVHEIVQSPNHLPEDISEKLNTAFQNDNSFIESIFGGKNNPVNQCPIVEAVRNVEFLIDFIPTLKEFIAIGKSLRDQIVTCGCEDNKQVQAVVRLILNSISQYCYRALCSMIHIYGCVNDKLNEKEKVAADHKVPEFQLF